MVVERNVEGGEWLVVFHFYVLICLFLLMKSTRLCTLPKAEFNYYHNYFAVL